MTSKKESGQVKELIFHRRIRVLRYVCCWPEYDSNTSFEKLYWVFCACFILNLSFGLSLAAAGTIQSCLDLDSVDESIEAIANQIVLFMIIFQVLLKSLIMILRAPRIRKLIEELNNCLMKDYVCNEEHDLIMKRCFAYDKRLSRFFLSVTMFVYLTGTLRPIMSTMRKVNEAHRLSLLTGNVTNFVPADLVSIYPFQVNAKSFWYPFWMFQQCMSIFPALVASWVCDSMFCGLLIYISGQFDILIHNMKNMKRGAPADDDQEILNLVKHHRYLISYSSEVTSTFSALIIVQVALGSLSIGLSLIQLALVNSLLNYLKPMAYLLFKFIQLYISTYVGQVMWDKSEEVAEACYFAPWYEKRKGISADFNIIMHRSQKPIKVAAGGVFQLSTGTFRGVSYILSFGSNVIYRMDNCGGTPLGSPLFEKILNTAYSVFTMMSTMKKD